MTAPKKLLGKNHALGRDFLAVGEERIDVHAGFEFVALDGHRTFTRFAEVVAAELAAVHVEDDELGLGAVGRQEIANLGCMRRGLEENEEGCQSPWQPITEFIS